MSVQKSFQMRLRFNDSDTKDPIAFKVDGKRFSNADKTFKFKTYGNYMITVETKPQTEFNHIHIGGSDLALLTLNDTSKEYQTKWYTNCIDPTKRATRQEIYLTLQGPYGIVSIKLQSKFYNKGDSHADQGHKLQSLILSCAVDGQGNIAIVDEHFE